MKNEEIIERLQDTESVIMQQGERIGKLENRETAPAATAIPDYTPTLNAMISEMRENSNTGKVDQLLSIVNEIRAIQKKQPVSVNRQWRILLFPDTDQGQYYKIVFGRLIPWGLLIVVITYLFILGNKVIDAYGRNKVNEQTLHYEKAWFNLRQHASKKTEAAMDNAYHQTATED